jgi:type VII secretion integral membrane protein EccD
MPYALVAGVLIPARSGSLGQLGSAQLLSGLAAVALTAVLAAAASGRLQLFLGVLIAAVVGVIGAGIEYAVGSLGFAGAAGVMVAPVLALTPLIPSVSFRLAGMALPQVPRHADDLRRDTLTVDGAAVFDRTAAADSFVTGAVAGIGLVGAGAELALALSPGWLPRLMCAVLGVALLLRARVFQGLAQRLWLMVPGYGGLILLALMATVTGSQLRHVAVMLLPLVAGAALVTGVGIWLASARPSPFWGRAADIADMLFVVGLFPLALAVAGVFGDIGHIAG